MPPSRLPAVVASVAAAVVLLTACSTPAFEETESAETSAPPVSGEWQCEEIPESPDGAYDVAGAGRVTIPPEGDQLSPVGAAAAEDYGNTEARLYDTAAEVEFRHRRDGSRVLFRADIEEEGRAVQICREQG